MGRFCRSERAKQIMDRSLSRNERRNESDEEEPVREIRVAGTVFIDQDPERCQPDPDLDGSLGQRAQNQSLDSGSPDNQPTKRLITERRLMTIEKKIKCMILLT